VIPPLPPRNADAQPHLAAFHPVLKPNAAARLAALLRANASVEEIRDQLFTGCSYAAVRGAVLRCALSDEFTRAIADAAPDTLRATAQAILGAWRNQDRRAPVRDRLRSLRRLVVDFERLAVTVRSIRSAQCRIAHSTTSGKRRN